MADEKKLSGEARIDALVKHLKEKHGISVPEEVEPEEKEEESEPAPALSFDEAPVEGE